MGIAKEKSRRGRNLLEGENATVEHLDRENFHSLDIQGEKLVERREVIKRTGPGHKKTLIELAEETQSKRGKKNRGEGRKGVLERGESLFNDRDRKKGGNVGPGRRATRGIGVARGPSGKEFHQKKRAQTTNRLGGNPGGKARKRGGLRSGFQRGF